MLLLLPLVFDIDMDTDGYLLSLLFICSSSSLHAIEPTESLSYGRIAAFGEANVPTLYSFVQIYGNTTASSQTNLDTVRDVAVAPTR